MKPITVRLDDELHAAVERARGKIPREPWIRDVLRDAVKPAKAGKPRKAGT